MTVTFDDGLVKLNIPPERVMSDHRLEELFDEVTLYLQEIGVECGGRYGLSIVVDYLDDRK